MLGEGARGRAGGREPVHGASWNIGHADRRTGSGALREVAAERLRGRRNRRPPAV
jgi:hypothetical protein